MYKYFCKLSLGLKFGEFYFGFTGYTMPMSKASKIWNKLSRSLSVIYFKRPVCLCLNPPSICMHVEKYILLHKYQCCTLLIAMY